MFALGFKYFNVADSRMMKIADADTPQSRDRNGFEQSAIALGIEFAAGVVKIVGLVSQMVGHHAIRLQQLRLQRGIVQLMYQLNGFMVLKCEIAKLYLQSIVIEDWAGLIAEV